MKSKPPLRLKQRGAVVANSQNFMAAPENLRTKILIDILQKS
jgi:hypothetical protein